MMEVFFFKMAKARLVQKVRSFICSTLGVEITRNKANLKIENNNILEIMRFRIGDG